jgi:E3 ubiquitin-protein ligase FANCL
MARMLSNLFPLLLPCDAAFSTYEGYIEVKGYQFWIRVSLGGESPLLDLDWQLTFLLKGLEDTPKKKLKAASNLIDFLQYFQHFIEDILESKGIGSMDCSPKSKFCESIVLELEEVGWSRVKSVGKDFSSLVLAAWDEGGREHHIECHLSAEYPDKPPVVHTCLPQAFSLKWKQKSSLKDMLNEFEKELTHFQMFWNILDEIDKKVWVLSPKDPNRAVKRRLFALGSDLFIQVILNPLHPCGVPDVKFVGSDHTVEEKHRKFSCAMDGWSVIKLLPGLPGLPWCPGYGIGRKSEGQICGLF